MADVNKKTLVESLAKDCDLTKKDAKAVVDYVFDYIQKNLKKGNKVDLSGFGKFEVKHRKARTGINPATKETIKIPASKVPGFKPAKAFKELVK